MGYSPICTIGLGRNSVSSDNRVPNPPANNATLIIEIPFKSTKPDSLFTTARTGSILTESLFFNKGNLGRSYRFAYGGKSIVFKAHNGSRETISYLAGKKRSALTVWKYPSLRRQVAFIPAIA
jgi:hypothetical protein